MGTHALSCQYMLRELLSHGRSIEHDQLFRVIDGGQVRSWNLPPPQRRMLEINVCIRQPGNLRDEVGSRRQRFRRIPDHQRQPREERREEDDLRGALESRSVDPVRRSWHRNVNPDIRSARPRLRLPRSPFPLASIETPRRPCRVSRQHAGPEVLHAWGLCKARLRSRFAQPLWS